MKPTSIPGQFTYETELVLAVEACHMVASLLVLDPQPAGRALFDTASGRILGQPFWFDARLIRVCAPMMIVFPQRLAPNAGVRTAVAACNSVPGVMIVELLARDEAATFVVDAVHPQYTMDEVFFCPSFVRLDDL
jgi:hypothetical protein